MLCSYAVQKFPIKVKVKFSQKGKHTKFRVPLTNWFFWSAAFIATATVSAALGASLALFSPLAPLLSPQNKQSQLQSKGFQYRVARPVNILVMGIDRVLDAPQNSPAIFNGRSDTMLLLRLDPTQNSLKVLSIPRDTRVESPGLSIPKMNQANVDGGSALAAQVVSKTLNNVPIDRYVRVSTGAFRELVDQIGGIEVFVPTPMQYVDRTQNLNIDLEQGWQTLNGDQAEQFARFRHDNKGDIGRVQRQQALIKALRQRLVNPTVLPRLPKIMQLMWKYVDSNLSLEETLALANFALGLQPDDTQMVMLPGRFSDPKEYSASYWVIDTQAKDRVMQQFFQQAPVEKSAVVDSAPSQIRIAIQNTTGQSELSQNVADYLTSKGYKNVYIIRDWPDIQRQTQIIAQKGDLQAARNIKNVLSLGQVDASSIGDISSEITIRVGKDWLEKLAEKK